MLIKILYKKLTNIVNKQVLQLLNNPQELEQMSQCAAKLGMTRSRDTRPIRRAKAQLQTLYFMLIKIYKKLTKLNEINKNKC